MYKRVLDTARLYLHKDDFVLGYLSSIALKRRESDQWVLAWSLIRQIDDIIDSCIDEDEKKNLLEYFNGIYKDILSNNIKAVDKLNLFEKYLYYYVCAEKQSEIKTIDCFNDILHSFEIDISRTNKILSWREYTDYLYFRSDRVLELYYKLYFRKNDAWIKELAYHYARVFQYVDDVLDLFDDLNVGQINITSDECKLLNIENIYSMDNKDTASFCKYRREKILSHYQNYLILVEDKVKSLLVKRYLIESIGYNISPIAENRFIPGETLRFPFESLLMKITNYNMQTTLFKAVQPIFYVYFLIPYYSLQNAAILDSSYKSDDAQRQQYRQEDEK